MYDFVVGCCNNGFDFEVESGKYFFCYLARDFVIGMSCVWEGVCKLGGLEGEGLKFDH